MIILLRNMAFKVSNSLVDMTEYFLDGLKDSSTGNTTWSVIGQQTAQAKRVY